MQATNFEAEFASASPAHGAQTLSARTGVDDFTLGPRRRFRPLLSGNDVPQKQNKTLREIGLLFVHAQAAVLGRASKIVLGNQMA